MNDREESHVEVVAAPPDSRSIWRAWYTLIVLAVQNLAVGIDLAIVSLLVHPIEATLHLNDIGFAAMTALPVGIGVVASYYPGGLLADTFRRRDMIAAGSVIWVIGALLAARADSGIVLFLARLLAGVGTGILGPAFFTMLTDAFPRTHRAVAVGTNFAGIAIGTGVGLTICGALVAATQRNGMVHVGGIVLSPWQQCFVAVAAMGVIVLALILTVPEPLRRDRSSDTNANLTSSLFILGKYLRRHWLLWALLFLGGTINAMSYASIGAWAPAFGMRHYGAVGVSSIALLGTFTASGALIGSIVIGLLVQRGINRGDSRMLPRLFIAIPMISCVFAAGFPYMPTWLLAVVGVGIVYAMLMALNALMMIAIQEAASNEVRGQLFGLWGFIGNTSGIVSPPLVAFLASGIFAKDGGLGPALAVAGGTGSALAVLLFAFSSGPYARAKREVRNVIVPSQVT